MRPILFVAAAALVVGVGTSTVVLAQNTKTDAARAARAQETSIDDSYNRCVSLAKSRGYTSSDLDGNRASARNFVINCMRGKQR
jgi:hypothetical protein